MGGFGSGRSATGARKRTVEECLALYANEWTREGILRQGMDEPGVWQWFRDDDPEQERGCIGFHVKTEGDSGFVTLEYTLGSGEASERLIYDIELLTTRPFLGGLRWWFSCPMCGRRVAKLYLGGRRFGCRTCHNLTYRSTQRAHSIERLVKLARALDRMELEAGLLR
jgi:hypothetical protein